MPADGLPYASNVVNGALDITGFSPAMNAANNAVNKAWEYSITTGLATAFIVVLVAIILALLGIVRGQLHRAGKRDKADSERDERDDKRYERDIETRDNLAKALHALSNAAGQQVRSTEDLLNEIRKIKCRD